MAESNFHIKSEGNVCLITLPDRTFSAFADALERVAKIYGSQKIFFMQSIEKENEPFKILIVFNFFDDER